MLKRIVSLFFNDCKKEGILCEKSWADTPEEGFHKFRHLGYSKFMFTTTGDQKKIESNEFTDIWMSEALDSETIAGIAKKYPYLYPPKKPIVAASEDSQSDYIIVMNPLRLLG